MKKIRRHNSIIAIYLTLGLMSVVYGCAGTSTTRTAKPEARPPEILDEMAYHYFSNGTILMLDNNFPAAADQFEKALTYEPDSRELRHSLGECYFNMREFDKAVTVVSAVTQKNADTWLLLAKYYRNLNREDDSYYAYRQVLNLNPRDTDAHWYLAQMEANRGRFDNAVALMERLTEIRLSSRMMIELGRMYLRAGKAEKAYQTLTDVTEGVYGSPPVDAYAFLVDMYTNEGRSDDLIALLRKALVDFPRQIHFREKLVNALIAVSRFEEAAAELELILEDITNPQDQIRLAALYFELGRYTDADSLFSVVQLMNPDQYLPELYLGRLKMMREQYDSAKVHLARAVEIDDEIPDAYLSWASVLAVQDSIHKAIQVAREGEFIAQPKNGLQFLIGVNYSRLEVYDSAAYWFERASVSEPADLRIRFSLGAAYERLGRFGEADSVFQTIIAVDSSNAAALNYLGYMYADSGIHLDTSLQLIERAINLEPENGAYLDSYAWVLYRLGRIDEAEVQIRQAIKHTIQEDPVVYDHFGDILARQGRMPEARDQWTKALELDPENETIKEKLQSEGL